MSLEYAQFSGMPELTEITFKSRGFPPKTIMVDSDKVPSNYNIPVEDSVKMRRRCPSVTWKIIRDDINANNGVTSMMLVKDGYSICKYLSPDAPEGPSGPVYDIGTTVKMIEYRN